MKQKNRPFASKIKVSIPWSFDQIAILQKADVFITHCGMNSVNEGLVIMEFRWFYFRYIRRNTNGLEFQ